MFQYNAAWAITGTIRGTSRELTENSPKIRTEISLAKKLVKRSS